MLRVRNDVGAPPERRGSTQRHAPIVGVAAALAGLEPGQCLEVEAATAGGWGYCRAYEAGRRWPGRQYRASRTPGGWRIWRVR